MGKHLANMLTGVMMSIFSYAAIFFLGIAIGFQLNLNLYYRYVISVGLDFLVYNMIGGAFGGYLGGDTPQRNGAIWGGLIAGVLAAVLRLVLIFVA